MIIDLLRESWEKLPPDMALELPFSSLLDYCCQNLSCLLGQEGSSVSHTVADAARRLYLFAPGIINVMLNYKICVYYQLPQHPTRYFEVPDEPGPRVYSQKDVDEAEAFFKEAVSLALAFYRLDVSALEMANRLKVAVPAKLLDFVYTSKPDNYTWRGSDPLKIKKLADSVLRVGRPGLIVGAAHGALMAGLVLALLLDVPVWFLRFSMFKRNDRGPVITPRDEGFLSGYAGVNVLALDEDSASGKTLGILSEKLAGLGLCVRTGAVIRHGASKFKPDHAGYVWWD